MKTKLQFKSFLLTKDHVLGMIKAMRSAGLKIDADWNAGTVKATYGKDTQVFFAIEKGPGQPWLVRHVVDLFE
jgi:hypothetical protein